MVGELQRRMSTKCSPESHAGQKEMCFLKVLPADGYLSAVIKVVKSSPQPPPYTHMKDEGICIPDKARFGIWTFPFSTWILQWVWWGEAQQGPGCAG